MTPTRARMLLAALALPLLAGCLPPAPLPHAAASAAPVVEPVSSVAAFDLLKAGNARYVAAEKSSGKPVRERRAQSAQTQHPFAIVIGCADSRTCPEIVFDQNLGDLFVIRTAGNLVDDYALGSIEYAVEHLGVRLIVVLGHERCGAVKAALAGGEAPGHIGALVRDIQPAVAATKGKPGDPLQNAVCANATLVSRRILQKAHLGDLASQVGVVVGTYDLDTGVVSWQP